MAITNKHDDYEAAQKLWQKVRIAAKGQDAIKDQGELYLPKPHGMKLLETEGHELYKPYKDRAKFPNLVQDTLRQMTGLIAKQKPSIDLPKAMQYLIENATADGFGLVSLYHRICNEVAETGRAALLVGVDSDGQPYIGVYSAESFINWQTKTTGGRKDLTLVVFQEQRPKETNDPYSHETEDVYRVVWMEDGQAWSVLRDEKGKDIGEAVPYSSGTKPLMYLPLVVTGSTDNAVDIDKVPLLTMAECSIKMYQLSADYNQSLHHTAHPQPVITGLVTQYDANGQEKDNEPKITGPFAAWQLPQGASASYLEISGTGIDKLREAIIDEKNAASEAGAKVLDVGVESGEARKARQSDQYASLGSIVTTVADGLQQALRYIADLLDVPSDGVTFTVEPEFGQPEFDAQTLQQLQNLAAVGVLSKESLFNAITTGKLPAHAWDIEQLKIEGVIGSDIPE